MVKEKNGDGHSVLTVKTNRGEFVLDNLSNEMRPWTRAPYRFVKRQSQQNQNAWVAIGAADQRPAVCVAVSVRASRSVRQPISVSPLA